MAYTISGVDASLRWGWHLAGTLHAWTVTKTESGWTLSATVVSKDTFRLSQQPIVFEAPHRGGVWRWPVITLQQTDASITATLGPKES